jgi:hypothetical protein
MTRFPAERALQLDIAAKPLDEMLGHREPHARSPARRLGGVEGIEGLLCHLGGHAAAGVGDPNADVASLTQICPLGAELGMIGLDDQPAAAGHRVSGIDRQIEQRVLELVGVANSRGWPLGQREGEFDAIAQRKAQQRLHRGDQLVHGDGLQIGAVRSREGEQAMGEGRRPVERHLGQLQQIRDLACLPPVDPCLHDIEGTRHALQHIVEIMGEADRHLAEDLHIARLAPCLVDLRRNA